MPEVSVNAFPAMLERDLKKLKAKIERGVKRAARKSVDGIRKRTPKAFGPLRESIHATEREGNVATIEVNAPHASAVEIGSMPHFVPIEPLIRWVKLRRLQGKRHSARMQASPKYAERHGTSTAEMIHAVKREFKKLARSGLNEDEKVIEVAKAIQNAIAKAGTRPHWYVRGSLQTVVMKDLDEAIKGALGQ